MCFLLAFAAVETSLEATKVKASQVKCKFNARAYANKYADLKRAFGYDSGRLMKHYKNHGLKERRTPCGNQMPSCQFNANVYWRLYPDVKRNRYFGASASRAKLHYTRHGMKEGRAICVGNKVKVEQAIKRVAEQTKKKAAKAARRKAEQRKKSAARKWKARKRKPTR